MPGNLWQRRHHHSGVSACLNCLLPDVAEATTGRGALDSARERAPDLVVLDVMLPDFDGLEVTRRLRSP